MDAATLHGPGGAPPLQAGEAGTSGEQRVGVESEVCCPRACLRRVSPRVRARVRQIIEDAAQYGPMYAWAAKQVVVRRFVNIQGGSAFCVRALATLAQLSEYAVQAARWNVYRYPFSPVYYSLGAQLDLSTSVVNVLGHFFDRVYTRLAPTDAAEGQAKGAEAPAGVYVRVLGGSDAEYKEFNRICPNLVTPLPYMAYSLIAYPCLLNGKDASATSRGCTTCAVLTRLLESDFNKDTREDANTIMKKHRTQMAILWSFYERVLELIKPLNEAKKVMEHYKVGHATTDELLKFPVEVYHTKYDPLKYYLEYTRKMHLEYDFARKYYHNSGPAFLGGSPNEDNTIMNPTIPYVGKGMNINEGFISPDSIDRIIGKQIAEKGNIDPEATYLRTVNNENGVCVSKGPFENNINNQRNGNVDNSFINEVRGDKGYIQGESVKKRNLFTNVDGVNAPPSASTAAKAAMGTTAVAVTDNNNVNNNGNNTNEYIPHISGNMSNIDGNVLGHDSVINYVRSTGAPNINRGPGSILEDQRVLGEGRSDLGGIVDHYMIDQSPLTNSHNQNLKENFERKGMNEILSNNYSQANFFTIVPPQSPLPGSSLCIGMSGTTLCYLPHVPGKGFGVFPMIGITLTDYTLGTSNLYIFPSFNGAAPIVDNYTTALERYLRSISISPGINLTIFIDNPEIFRSPIFMAYLATVAVVADYKPSSSCVQHRHTGRRKKTSTDAKRKIPEIQIGKVTSGIQENQSPQTLSPLGQQMISKKVPEDPLVHGIGKDNENVIRNANENLVGGEKVTDVLNIKHVKRRKGQNTTELSDFAQLSSLVSRNVYDIREPISPIISSDSINNANVEFKKQHPEYDDASDIVTRDGHIRAMNLGPGTDSKQSGVIRSSIDLSLSQTGTGKRRGPAPTKSKIFDIDDPDYDLSLNDTFEFDQTPGFEYADLQDYMQSIYIKEREEENAMIAAGKMGVPPNKSIDDIMALSTRNHPLPRIPTIDTEGIRDGLEIEKQEDFDRPPTSFQQRLISVSTLSVYAVLIAEGHDEQSTVSYFEPAEILREIKSRIATVPIFDGFSLTDFCKILPQLNKIIQCIVLKSAAAHVENYVLQEDLELMKTLLKNASFCYLSPHQIHFGIENDLKLDLAEDITKHAEQDNRQRENMADIIAPMSEPALNAQGLIGGTSVSGMDKRLNRTRGLANTIPSSVCVINDSSNNENNRDLDEQKKYSRDSEIHSNIRVGAVIHGANNNTANRANNQDSSDFIDRPTIISVVSTNGNKNKHNNIIDNNNGLADGKNQMKTNIIASNMHSESYRNGMYQTEKYYQNYGGTYLNNDNSSQMQDSNNNELSMRLDLVRTPAGISPTSTSATVRLEPDILSSHPTISPDSRTNRNIELGLLGNVGSARAPDCNSSAARITNNDRIEVIRNSTSLNTDNGKETIDENKNNKIMIPSSSLIMERSVDKMGLVSSSASEMREIGMNLDNSSLHSAMPDPDGNESILSSINTESGDIMQLSNNSLLGDKYSVSPPRKSVYNRVSLNMGKQNVNSDMYQPTNPSMVALNFFGSETSIGSRDFDERYQSSGFPDLQIKSGSQSEIVYDKPREIGLNGNAIIPGKSLQMQQNQSMISPDYTVQPLIPASSHDMDLIHTTRSAITVQAEATDKAWRPSRTDVIQHLTNSKMSMAVCLAASTLPFIPSDINHILVQKPQGFIGMMDVVKINKFIPIVSKCVIEANNTFVLPMLRPYIPQQILRASTVLGSDVGWMSLLQNQIHDVVNDLVDNYEVDSDTYSWWVTMLMKFSVAGENEDMKVMDQREKELSGPLSRYIVGICNKLPIPDPKTIRGKSEEIAKKQYKQVNNIDPPKHLISEYLVSKESPLQTSRITHKQTTITPTPTGITAESRPMETAEDGLNSQTRSANIQLTIDKSQSNEIDQEILRRRVGIPDAGYMGNTLHFVNNFSF